MDENELKDKITQLEAENNTFKADIEKLKTTITERDGKITELQTYICKNLTTPVTEKKDVGGVKDFATLYKETLSELGKNKS